MCTLVDEAAPTGKQGDLYIRSVCFSPCGKWLATGAEDKIIRIWDIAKKRIRGIFDGHQQEIYALEFSLDGRLLVSGSGDKTARVWDVGSALGTSSSSSATTSASGSGAEMINDSAKPTVLTITDNASDKMKDVDVDGDAVYPPKDDSDRQAGEGSGDRMDVDHGSPETNTANDDADATDAQNSTDAGITSIAVSPDGRYVAAGSLDSVIRLWDLRQTSSSSGERQPPVLIERLKGHKDSVYSVSFTKDGRFFVSASLDKGVRVWDVGHLGIVPASGSSSSSSSPSRGVGNRQSAKGNERTVTLGGKGKQKSRCVTQFVGHRDYVLSVAVSFDGRWVVSGSKDRGVMWWDLGLSSSEDSSSSGESSASSNTTTVTKRDREAVCVLQGHKNSVISIDLSPVGNLLATGSGDWQARIWSYKTA
ncbi:hypothetical protein EST38_g12249 [Candolleomyces aberdarensis]|uniref:Uncharacterized protein n=1 Tax=Candolleomyces aberdarensis TaxID=2316362 RepID=A0A4Q2D3M7_9AGAR|nr:hypothetical protein EST38_g12249 [Candolleomyces aberdarensis]